MSCRNSRGSRQQWNRPRNTYCSSRGGRSGAAVATTPAPSLGSILESISVDDLVKNTEQQSERAQIKNCHVIASYNWLEKPGACILTPGMPPKWTPVLNPRQLQGDNGTYYSDRNAAQYPRHPMEPTVEAIMGLRPQTGQRSQVKHVDLVACNSTLGNLLRFVRQHAKGFRMLLKVVGSTVHFIRRENSPRETIPDVKGFGHTFPEANTTWDSSVRGSSSHQRILGYQFGGLDCMVRFSADGYLPDKVDSPEASGKAGSVAEVESESVSLENLAASLAGNNVSAPLNSSEVSLKISSGGEEVPQCALFDLKTRSKRFGSDKEGVLASEVHRLWLAQLPNFILAYHSSGIFDNVEVIDTRDTISKWETESENELRLFAALLQRIVRSARQRRGERLELTRGEGENFLRIRELMHDVPPAFSESTEKRWKAWLAGETTQGDDDGAELRGSDDIKETTSSTADGEWRHKEDDYTACDDECGYCGRCKH